MGPSVSTIGECGAQQKRGKDHVARTASVDFVSSANSLHAQILLGEVGDVALVDPVQLLTDLGVRVRSGQRSHRIFTRTGVIEIVSLQMENGDAKRHQVRQVTGFFANTI
jgi:hypothetical protein